VDLEGNLAKWKAGTYVADNRRSSWVKIKTQTTVRWKVARNYSNASRRNKYGYAVIRPLTFSVL